MPNPSANDTTNTPTLDGTQLYWGFNSTSPLTDEVRRLSANGAQQTFSSVAGSISSVIVSGGFAYWNQLSRVADLTTFFRASTTAATPVAGTSIGTVPVLSNLMVVAGSCVYSRTGTTGTSITRTCVGGASVTVYTGTGVIKSMMTDAAGVYFAEELRGISRMALNSNTPTITSIRTSTTDLGSMAQDGEFIYYVDGSDAFQNCTTNWSVNRVPKAGGASVRLVAPPIACPNALQVDGTSVYWANSQGGQIMKVAK